MLCTPDNENYIDKRALLFDETKGFPSSVVKWSHRYKKSYLIGGSPGLVVIEEPHIGEVVSLIPSTVYQMDDF